MAGPRKQPPRHTRFDPEAGPSGSVAGPLGSAHFQSQHHSQTFPCMSYSPQALGRFPFTGCVSSSEFSRYQDTLCDEDIGETETCRGALV